MKKLYSLGFAALVLLAVSCVKENGLAPEEKPVVDSKCTVVANIEGETETRTTVVQDQSDATKYHIRWAEGDMISMIALSSEGSAVNVPFALKDGVGSGRGVFEGDFGEYSRQGMAFYPHSENHNLMRYEAHLPSEYGSVDKEYTPNTNALMISLGVSSGSTEVSELYFMHLGGVLCLDLRGIPANTKGVVLTANKGITGNFTINTDDEFMVEPVEPTENNNSITIWFKPVDKLRSEMFYFPLPVGTYQFKVEYVGTDGAKTPVVDSKKDNTIGRAVLKSMPELVVENAKIEFSDIAALDSKVTVDIAPDTGDYYYYIASLGYDATNPTYASRADTDIQSAVKYTADPDNNNIMSDGKYKASNGSLLAWYYAYMGTTTYKFSLGTSVYVGLVPADSRDVDHVVYKVVTLKGYTINNDSDARVSITYDPAEQTSTKVKATIIPDEGVSYRYTSTPLTQAQYDVVKDDNEAMLKKVGTSVKTSELEFAYTCTPEQTYYLLVYAFNPTTAEGKIQVQKLESPAVAYNENVELNVEVMHQGFRYVDVKIEPKGGELKQIRWGYMTKSKFETNATLTANGTELEKMMEIAEEQLAINKTITQRGLIEQTYLAEDNLYSVENMFYNEDTYLFIMGIDNDDVPTRMVYKLLDLNENDPIANFDANLAAPKVKDVYYIANSTGYKQALSNWTDMNTVADVTALDSETGMYWLDLDWSEAGGEPKRMWLSSNNDLNDSSKGLITGDAKHDALEVLKKRSGSAAGSGGSPDFYGKVSTTGRDGVAGAPLLTDVALSGTTENATLRNKKTDPISPKTLFLVWETNEGKYGYMTVNPEEYAPLPKPGNIQVAFNMEGMGPAILDFGVTTPGYLAVAIDLDAFYGEDCPPALKGWYMAYAMSGNPLGWAYEVVATDATSGVIRISTVNMNMDGGVTTTDYPYSGYVNDATPFTIDGMLVMAEDDVVVTPVSKPVKVYIEGVTTMPEVEYAKPDNIQVSFTMTEMGNTPAVLDFGVTTPGKIVVGIDASAMGYAGLYVLYQQYDYEMVATNASSGVIRIAGVDYAYSGYVDNETSFTVDGSFIGGDDFVVTPVSSPVQVYDPDEE